MMQKAKRLFLLLLIGLPAVVSHAQDTEYWFVVPDIDHINSAYCGDTPGQLILTAGEKDANVTVKYKGGDKQVTRSIPAGTTQIITFARNPGAGQYSMADLENIPANSSATKNKFGIHITSDSYIYASYQADGSCLRDLFTLKGERALGTHFYLPFQNKTPLQTVYPKPERSFNIVASEDNTNITVNLKNGTLKNCGAATTLNFTLNAGETWAGVGSSHTQLLFGTEIISDKDIAVTVHENTLDGDLIGDQIVPVSNLSKSYIVLRTYPVGRTPNRAEYAFIMATENNTTLSIIRSSSATPSTVTLANAGDMYELAVSEEYYAIQASHPVSVYHLAAYLSDQEPGASILPSMYSIQSRDISFYKPSESMNHYIFIIAHKDNVGNFLVNGSSTAIPAGNFTAFSSASGLSDWRYLRMSIASWPSGINRVRNTKGAFSLGYMLGNNTSGSYGYLSAFGEFKFANDTVYKCPGSSVTLDGSYAKSYLWIYPDGTTQSTPSVTVTQPGKYKLEMNQDPRIVVDSFTLVDIHYNASVSHAPAGAVKAGTPVALSVQMNRIPGLPLGYQWTFPSGSSPASSTAA
ncbi:MAG: IgGFc-binding protein, partial [Tannerella sp.]|nr:IgGFc-binding protein [Tannerella sp.]